MFAASIPLAFISPGIAKLFWLALFPANLVLERRYGKEAYGA